MTDDSNAFQLNAPASAEALSSLRTKLDNPLPEHYLAFLERSNGGEGFIGERYVRLWRAEELLQNNRNYNVAEFFPNFFFIGTDGGGEAYAFDISGNATVFQVPFIGMPSDTIAIASSLDALLAS